MHCIFFTEIILLLRVIFTNINMKRVHLISYDSQNLDQTNERIAILVQVTFIYAIFLFV